MRLESGWIAAAGAAVLLAGCGSEQDKMERGVAVDREVAVPESEKELGMTEAERRAAERDEEKKREARLFEESQQ
jgi:hypothetical protein